MSIVKQRPKSQPVKAPEEYRVFISYSHQDSDLVAKLEQILTDNGLHPMRDKNFAFGCGFHEQIKTFITHAHVFLPLITTSSSRRGWVHQEIGYAMAQNVPVLPVTVGIAPGEMLQTLHAVSMGTSPGDLDAIAKLLTFNVFDNLVNRYRDSAYASYQVAEFTEDRARMFAEHANSVLNLRQTGLVRQKGALSSFHIPSRVISDAVWQARYGKRPLNRFHCRALREERLALTKHQEVSGCKLIVNPRLKYEALGAAARIVRLSSLLEFLKGTTNELAQVAINEKLPDEISVTIVGDWFAAESVSATIGHGYRQTIFTGHAPSMRNRIDLFDQEFEESLGDCDAKTSREKAIEYLERLLRELRG